MRSQLTGYRGGKNTCELEKTRGAEVVVSWVCSRRFPFLRNPERNEQKYQWFLPSYNVVHSLTASTPTYTHAYMHGKKKKTCKRTYPPGQLSIAYLWISASDLSWTLKSAPPTLAPIFRPDSELLSTMSNACAFTSFSLNSLERCRGPWRFDTHEQQTRWGGCRGDKVRAGGGGPGWGLPAC